MLFHSSSFSLLFHAKREKTNQLSHKANTFSKNTMADIESFLTFTSSQNEDVARQYLEMAGGNLETAVGLYMEMGGENGLSGGTGVGMDNDFGMNAAAAAGGGGGDKFASSSAAAAEVGPDGLDPSLDAATRAAILAAQGPSGPSPVRAPDQTRTMRLVGGDSPYGGGAHAALLSAVAGPHAAAAAAMMDDDLNAMGSATWGMDVRDNVNREAERRMARGRNSGDTNEDAVDVDESDDDLDDEDAGRGRGSANAAPSLSTMFSPPTHLMHRAGGFQGARNVAKDARRWLLVNVQSDGDFACHALNRDVWRDELVENLVREGFIFWQVVSTELLHSLMDQKELSPCVAGFDPAKACTIVHLQCLIDESNSSQSIKNR
jgi:hypothetical protein